MLDKLKQIGKLNKLRSQAMKLKKALANEEAIVEEGVIRVVISGDQKFKDVVINGQQNKALVDALNKSIKKSQKIAAQKMKTMDGGLDMFGL